MYFVLAQKPIYSLPYHYQVNGLYLSSIENLQQNSLAGYRLVNHGGNYVEFDLLHPSGLKIEFSFYKDFTLGRNDRQKIILTNLPDLITEKIKSPIISVELDENKIKIKNYDIKKFLNPNYKISFTQLLKSIEKQIVNNLKTCLEINKNTYIVYSGGLDSATLTMLAEYNNLDFSVLMLQNYLKCWPKLPFKKIIAVNCLLDSPAGNVDIDFYHNIKKSFYQNEYNFAINGYYGDLSMLHLSDLFHQCKHLSLDVPKDLYDRSDPTPYELIDSEQQLRSSILKLHMLPNFRHWFKKFQILDPYRDPTLAELVLQLGLTDLINQLGTANLQKELIKKCNPNWLDLVCNNKNDYAKFK